MTVKKKLLHIVEAFGGGVFTYLVALANFCCEEFEVIIAYAIRPQTPENAREYFDPRVKFIEVKNFGRSIDPRKDISAFFEVGKIVKQVRPDIVHCHSSKAGFIGRMAVNGRKIPTYYTPHGYAFLKEDDSKARRVLYKWVEKIGADKGGTILSVSRGEHQASLTLTKRAVCIDNGIDIGMMPEPLEINYSRPKRVAAIGRICYQKNPELFNQVALACPEMEFVWIGAGEDENCLHAPNVKITGWVVTEKAMEYLNEADIFLIPSRWEGLPIALLEAMYLKKVCIASGISGNRDVIRHGVNGFLASEAAEYLSIIRDIREGKIDTETLVQNAHEEIAANYSKEVMAGKYMELYRQAWSGQN